MSNTLFGYHVEAIIDLLDKNVKKGDRGFVYAVDRVESNNVLSIEMKNGDFINSTLEKDWKVSEIKQLEHFNFGELISTTH